MADLLQQGAAWLEDQRKRHAAQTVTYVRGGQSVEVVATIGRTEFEIIDDFGLLTKTISRDYLVTAEDLVLAGAPVLPERGDRVRESNGSEYEVLAPSGGPHYRWSDPYRITLRIHTKEVA